MKMSKKAIGKIMFLLIILIIVAAIGYYGNTQAETCEFGWNMFCWKW